MIVSARRQLAARIAGGRRGFTLLEVLVVVAILVILAGVAGVYVFGFFDDAKLSTAQNQCKTIEDAVKMFQLKPAAQNATFNDVRILVSPQDFGINASPALDGGISGVTDPWNRLYVLFEYQYQGKPEIGCYSTGPDGNQQILSKGTASKLGRTQ